MTMPAHRVVIVAQTPFHLFSAILIRQMLDVPTDLWLLDPTLARYEERCRRLAVWHEVFYAEVNAQSPGMQSLQARMGRLLKVRALQGRVAAYLRRIRPTVVVIFSDNHEITAAFARLGEEVANARVIMAEEGNATSASFRQFRAGWFKRQFRRMLGIDNPEGYSIGWSPHIHALLLSDPSSAHADYLQQRDVFQYPSGPYPPQAVEEHLNLLDLDFSGLAERDIVYLGGAWDESVAVPEMELLQKLDCSSIGGRILLKPHPFDPQGKYNSLKRILVTDAVLNSVPAELILGRIQPSVVLSLTSSALINYCMRYRCPGIFIALPALPADALQVLKDGLPKDEILRVVQDPVDLIPEIERALAEQRLAPTEALAAEEWRRVIRLALGLGA